MSDELMQKLLSETEFTCVLNIAAELGECPVWSEKNGALYWIDVKRPSLNRFLPANGMNYAMPMPSDIGSFALRSGGGFLLALRSGIWLADDDGKLLENVVPPPFDGDVHRFNDGRCDRQGRFLIGSINEQRDKADAGLWRLDTDFHFTPLLTSLTTSNGLGFSPDGKTLYHADTPTLCVHKYRYDPTDGSLTDRSLFASWTSEEDRPDGAAVDAEGNYWVALYRGGRIAKFSPAGQLLVEYPVPAMCPTMCAFGDKDLRTLYVTTARSGRTPQEIQRFPFSGGLFAMRTSVPGIVEPRFGH